MKNAGFDPEEVKSIVLMPEVRVAIDVAGRGLSRFLFCLANPVLMQPLQDIEEWTYWKECVIPVMIINKSVITQFPVSGH